MFNLESYITPVILSYVEKYVKNFKPEQSQVSLWGGDASFQNLDLRLEVLEEQLNLPFSFVSGHIHELLIHVPWVKITSEPVIVTINTIECILKLKDDNGAGSNACAVPKRKRELVQEETPPGYIKNMVTKVVNNIVIHCNNVILKYVEEDIVLSVNIRFLSMQTVNDKWEPAFTDVSSYEVMLRKIIKIQDLTLCLDKMDTSGKIEVYQDPVLYRCSMIIRLIVNYHSNTAKRASITRLDLHCQKMEFSMTEQQIPMLLRLVALVMALQAKQLPVSRDKSLITVEEREDASQDESDLASGSLAEGRSWGGWAWDTLSSFLPVNLDNDWSNEQQMAYTGHTIHLGMYVDDAVITFKTIESVKEQLFYKARKIRYKSFLSLRLTGVVVDALLQGITTTSLQVGMGSILLYPRGTCSCEYSEVIDGIQPPLYVTAGKLDSNHLKDSLFDKDSVENKGKRRIYKQGIDYHLAAVSVQILSERCPAFAMDYVHCIELPDDITFEKLSEFGSNFEYSNFHERRITRYVVGELTIRLCLGLFHRVDALKKAAMKYDYSPYIILKPDPTIDELPPVTMEEYEALRDNVSMVQTKLILIKGVIELQLADHRNTGLPQERTLIENRTVPLTPALSDDPVVTIEWDKMIVDIDQPMYPFRLVACASKQADISSDMFNYCHRIVNAKVHGLRSQLYLTKNCHTSIVMPCIAEYCLETLLYPQYWRSLDLVYASHAFQVDSITITGTKAKLMVVTSIVTSIFYPVDTANPFICSSLFTDACQEKNSVYLELSVEDVNYKNMTSSVTISNVVNISSIKMFALNDSQQAFILSGPESDHQSEESSTSLLTATIQFSKDPVTEIHPPVLSFKVAEIRGSLDPLLYQWLRYQVTYCKLNTLYSAQPESPQYTNEGPSTDIRTRKRTFPSLHESVHSSSDKERRKSSLLTDGSKTISKVDVPQKFIQKSEDVSIQKDFQKTGILTRIVDLYPWWCGLVLSGYIEHIVIYMPTKTMSGIGVHGLIEQAKNQALKQDESLQVLVIKLPALLIHSVNVQPESLIPYLKQLPIMLPKSIWTPQTLSFPWILNVIDFHCYTLQRETQKNLIKKVSLNATIGLTSKTQMPGSVVASKLTLGNALSALSLCVHVDTSPVIVSVSEEQILFVSGVVSNVLDVVQIISCSKKSVIIPDISNEAQAIPPVILTSTSPTRTLFREDSTTTSTMSLIKDDSEQEKDSLTLTAWIQWTITKVAVKLYVTGHSSEPLLKLVLELEDIITSLDLQPVYLKLKSKITTATIFHYTRTLQVQNWDLGEYGGLIMCGKEDSIEKGGDSGFLSLILTRAKSGNVYTRWSAHDRHKTQKNDSQVDFNQYANSYVSEIVIKIQMVDIIVPLSVLGKYVQLICPFTRFLHFENKVVNDDQKRIISPIVTDVVSLSNDSLPLIYLEFKGFRLMLPALMTAGYESLHDLLVLQLDGIGITPHAENPVCRTLLRSDIYQLAAQANILNIPGSAVEDRQYQINVKSACAYTTTWKNYQLNVTKRMSQSHLYTMNENPALEWNKLGDGSSIEPHFSTFPMITRFDLCIIIAPAIIFKPDTVVSGNAIEVNCISDIEMAINLDQIRLISILHSELNGFLIECFQEKKLINPSVAALQCSCPITSRTKQDSSFNRIPDEPDVDFTKDSGVDFEMSSINSTIIGKSSLRETAVLPPYEFLVNCGKITFVLYKTNEASSNSENALDAREMDDDDCRNMKQPLFYVMIDQPNIYMSQQHLVEKIQVSCFDMTISLGSDRNQNLTLIPNQADFKVCLVETKSGDPHPGTGIPPSFFVVKCQKNPGKNLHFSINMGRPTKIHCSLSRLNHIDSIKNQVLACFLNKNTIKISSESPRQANIIPPQSLLQSNKYNIPDLDLTTEQIVLSMKTDSGSEIIFSLAAFSGSTSTTVRPQRISGNVSLDSIIISMISTKNILVLLKPWSCNIAVYFLWESWQDADTDPQVQVQADSDIIYLDFGTEQMKILNTVMQDCRVILNQFVPYVKENKSNEKQNVSLSEQHYKDDLKAGAFQFIDGNSNDLPFPYQVVFFTHPQQAMAWRYPQPRMLTRLHVSPVPFKSLVEENICQDRVPCSIEYWSETYSAYQRYADFYLSETDSYYLDLPDRGPARAVACVWRVVLISSNSQTFAKTLISARALAACLRIDSYFNPVIVPTLQVALNIEAIHIAFYNHIDSSVYNNNLPPPLHNYTLYGMIPETQCVLSLEHKKAIVVLNRWIDGKLMVDVSGILSVHVLDYGLLNMHEVLEPLEGKMQLYISNNTDISIICNPFSLKFGPATVHTLAVSAYLWAVALEEDNKSAIILTRYVIANDSNIAIRFSQSNTDESILLQSRQCYFYSWRHVNNQTIRISVQDSAWTWSSSFVINKDGIHVVEFSNALKDIVIYVNVTSLSATQKLVTFTGQLIISNQLIDNFEMKLIKYEETAENVPVALKGTYIVAGKSQLPSMIIENNKNMAIRLRFFSSTNLSWTGDIPLQPNAKCSQQPWLVKVPLQERGQFLSIWVRIVTQIIHGRIKVLAILSPLYMIRSHLPIPAKVQIDTPSLKVSLCTTVNGRGERQQLYCPGTFEHFHQLTFQLESGISASNPYVPLSYSSVDQRKFFKRPEKEDIETILKELEDPKSEEHWPFQNDTYEWVPAEQPQTHVQVKYLDAELVSSTLLLELQPWCFILNSLGCLISLVSEDIELCQVPHYGIVAPPKLEGTFHLGIGLGNTYYTSSALQMARLDWSQSFYMPRIGGLIPVEGSIRTSVDCGSSLCIVNINSNMHKDMRLVRITSSHVIGNLSSLELCVATLAVHEASNNLQLPADLTPYSFNILPSEDQRQAKPIVQWHMFCMEYGAESVALYISLSLGHQWSCPIRVDQGMTRRCLAIPNDCTTVPVVVTTQEIKGTTYIMIHTDDHPQLLVDNKCSFNILLGQANATADGIVPDTPHFSWICCVESGATCHYSLPVVGSRLPDSPIPIATPSLLLTAVRNDADESTDNSLKWSEGINLSITYTLTDQYVRLPVYGDIKLTMFTRCHTTYINILPVPQVEVSAGDIRSRLLHTENKPQSIEMIYKHPLAHLEEEKKLNAQSSLSSTSVASFFSAQEDITATNSSICSQPPLTKLNTNVKSMDPCDSYDELTKPMTISNEGDIQKGSLTIYLREFTIIITQDVNENGQKTEVASLCMANVFVALESKRSLLSLRVYIGDLQFDNHMFDQGGFDFPVVLISQNPPTKKEMTFLSCTHLNSIMEQLIENSLIAVSYVWEVEGRKISSKDLRIKLAPISAYIEDTYITQLLNYVTSIIPPCFIMPNSAKNVQSIPPSTTVYVTDGIIIDTNILSAPLRLQSFIIEPVSILLSVHTSIRLYVALDHSPLYFGTFERKNLLTTPYRLGNALTMHYLSGAIFGAGWVVGSLEILGSPGGLAQALGSGLRDFVSLPFQGLLQGPWGFIVGITHGSASLMKHVTAGTVNSVTKLASSVARNLDRLTLDQEHLQRQEESRRMRPQGVTQGFYQGLTSFGMSLLAAVAGLAHHPLQQVWSGEATTRGLVTGVGIGLVGVVTKPLSGAAELVALTGQGLLQGVGWSSLPSLRQRPIVQYSSGSNNASVRYAWRLTPLLANGHDNILHVTSVDRINHQSDNQALTLVLTRQALLLINATEDTIEQMFSLNELTSVDQPSESTIFCLHYSPTMTQFTGPLSSAEQSEMDQEMRERVAEFVRTSSIALANLPTNSDAQSDTSDNTRHPDNTLTFYVSSDSRNYLLSMFNIAKRQNQGRGFTVF